MKSRFDADFLGSNNYLKLHGYAMARFAGKRKNATVRELIEVPFYNSMDIKKGRRVRGK